MTDERMPEAEVYEEELKYMPYAASLRKVVELVVSRAPRNGRLVDLMCGTGYLLGEIGKQRRDLSLVGIDIDSRYVDFAREHHPGIDFERGDVLFWQPTRALDIFTCTGALHHVPYEQQEHAVRNMANMIHALGLGIVSDCYIGDYNDELERKLAAAKMGYEYLVETMRNGSPDEVTAVTAEILRNDVMGVEFKTSLALRLPVFKKFFRGVETFKTWPDEQTDYGDYVTALENRGKV
jgi:2-polyprenyl-3-methyl-5-hydroxy-6-metoxy-1,4-benzoquinol methylase